MLCPRCQNVIESDCVNLQNLVAKCRRCHEVFSFADNVQKLQTGRPVVPTKRVPRPEGCRVEEAEGTRRIVQRWFSYDVIGLLFFCTFWDGFLAFWYIMACFNDAPLMAFVFPIAHVLVGVGITYFALTGLFNRTVVELADDVLKVELGPLPWPGHRAGSRGVLRPPCPLRTVRASFPAYSSSLYIGPLARTRQRIVYMDKVLPVANQ